MHANEHKYQECKFLIRVNLRPFAVKNIIQFPVRRAQGGAQGPINKY